MTQPAVIRRIDLGDPTTRGPDPLLEREWLVTNGLGGYASGTLAGIVTRRYHGLLVAALPTPLGRTVMLNHLTEAVRIGDTAYHFGGEELAGGSIRAPGLAHVTDFRLEDGLPVWRFEVDGVALEKRILMPHFQNTVHIGYTLLAGDDIDLQLRPALHFRGYDERVDAHGAHEYAFRRTDEGYEITGDDHRRPPLRLHLVAGTASFHIAGAPLREVYYRTEARRGYTAVGELWSPGRFEAKLARGQPVTLIASTEEWETAGALTPEEAVDAEHERRSRLLDLAAVDRKDTVAAELVLAADPFIVIPWGRREHAIRARAGGDELRTVIAGYHWFTDWGRDTMISLEGLALTTGRHREAGYILRTFGRYVRDGLIPNMFPDSSNEGLYHTADATLWLFHALDRYVRVANDRGTLRRLLPILRDILEHHLAGTRFGIGVDPGDGLLTQGAPGYQLTWMDAKVEDWVVTPRRGKPVEINALWYNALCCMEDWCAAEAFDDPATWAAHASRARESFNARFPIPGKPWLFDVVDGEDGDDEACRPNQIFAISLPHAVLDSAHWRPVLETVRAKLLTPVGLRSLSPDHPAYEPRYDGDLRARDAAYHQGTVWGWLVGPWIDAWLRVHPGDHLGAAAALTGLVSHMDDFGIGTLAEIYDAEPPFTPRGCIAQAWSIAEALRTWRLTHG